MKDTSEALADAVRAEAHGMVDRELLEAIYCMLRENILAQQNAANAAHLEALGFIADGSGR